MKDVTAKNKKLWLWLTIGAAALLVAAGVVLALVLGGGSAPADGSGRHQLYWNIDGESFMQGAEAGLSTRQPDSNGIFRIRFATDGTVEEFTTADKKLVNLVDSMSVMALELNGNEILDAMDPSALGYVVRKGVYVESVSSGTITCNSSVALNGMPIRARISDELQVLDVRADAQEMGAHITPKDLDALDYVFICATEDQVFTHVFLAGRSPRSSIYWRASQQYSSTDKQTTRVPDENGVYTVDFFCDGQLVELKCKDKELVTNIDKANRFTCHFALEFDEEGYITKTKLSSLGIKGTVGCSNFVVTELDGGLFTALAMSGSDAGATYTNEIDETCPIYDVSKTAKSEGRQGAAVESLQLGDRVVVWTDVDGYPVAAYISLRLTDVPAYFNMERKWSSYYKETLREPDSQGYYSIELLKSGETKSKIYKTKDKALVEAIDSRGDRTVGIRAEGNILTTVYEAECIFGYTNQGPRYVTTANGAVFSAMTYKKAQDVISGVMGADCKVYDVSGTGPLGAETTLRIGDLIIIHRNPSLETVQIYVTKRAMGVEYAYYNLECQYDSEKKITKREPVNGFYEFRMANQGKIVTVKTASKELATKMDAFAPPAMGLVVNSSGIVQYAFDPINISGALRVAYYSTVTGIGEDGTVSAVTSTGITSTFTPADDCVYYNCSQVYSANRGEKTSGIRVGDMVTGYLDMYGEAKVVFILSRDTGDIAWNTQRKYNATTSQTTRQPVDGWYAYALLVGGKLQTVKTRDKELASKIDSYDGAFGVVVKDGIIINAMSVGLVKNVDSSGVNGWDVVSLNGSKVTLRYTKPGSEKYTGMEKKVTLAKNVKIYDVSPTAASYGKEVKLQLGDRVRTYLDENENVLYVYVLYHATRGAGTESYCDHCKQVVHWEPWNGAGFPKADRHYYMNCDVEKTVVLNTSGSSTATNSSTGTGATAQIVPYEIVLDLNGKTMKVNGSRCFTVNNGQTLTIMDSAGGGTLTSGGPVNGGAFNVQKGGVLNLQSGTFKGVVDDGFKGGVVYVVAGGTVNISGKAVVDGSGVTSGKGTGGTIYSNGTVNISGGEVKGGSVGSGGSINIQGGDLNISGGKISGGQAANYGDEVFVNNAESVVTISGGQVSGQLQISSAKGVTLSGAPKLGELKPGTTVKLALGELTTGADIVVAVSGGFTEPSQSASAYAAFFRAKDSTKQVLAIDNVLTLVEAGAYYADCAHCNANVLWMPWKAAYTESGHYFLDQDANRSVHYAPVAADVVLDLNGKTFKADGARAIMVNDGITVTVMDTVGTGIITANGTENGGVFSVKDGGTLNFRGGTAKAISAPNAQQGSIAYIIAGGTLNVSGGVLDASAVQNGKGAGSAIYSSGNVTVSGGQIKGASVGSGGSIYMNAGNLTVTGGKISGGQAANYGDEIFVNNTESVVTISGGQVSGQFQISAARSVTVSGAPKLGELKPGTTVKLALGELTTGADIKVAADGIFTEASESVQTYAEYFDAADSTKEILIMDNALSVVEAGTHYANCTHCNSNVLWRPWKPTHTESGHYFLQSGVSRSVQYTPAGQDMVLDLCGQTFTTTGARTMLINNGITFTIVNSGDGGAVIGSANVNGGVFSVQAGGTLNLQGITAKGVVNASSKGSVLYLVEGGTVNISGNAVIDGSAMTPGEGAGSAIYSSGTVNISGGEIKGGSVGSGGSIYVNAGKLNISGGKISGGQAANYGDDIFVNNADAEVTVSGGEIAGQIQVEKAKTFTVSGAPKLANLKLVSAKLTLGELNNEAKIAVDAAGEFSAANAKAKDYLEAGIFTAFSADQTVEVTEGGVLYIPANVPKCPHCDVALSEINWQVWNAATAKETSGHYYLTGKATRTSQFVPTAGDVVIDLRGNDFAVTTANTRAFLINSGITLTVMDTTGNGTVTGLRTTYGSAYNVQSGGTLNLYGGTAAAGYAATSGSVVYVQAGGTLNIGGSAVLDGSAVTTGSGTRGTVYSEGNIVMTGGEIKGASAGSGGSIYVASGNLTVSGGKISGGQAANYGDDIFVNNAESVVSFSDCQILGQIQLSQAASVTVSGAPQLGNVKTSANGLLTLGELTADADIKVAADGAFSVASANAKAYLDAGCFSCVTAGKTIREESGVLIIE